MSHKSIAEVLAGPALSAEDQLWAETVFKPIAIWQDNPVYALQLLSGIVVPPHERIMLAQAHRGAPTNVNVSSRGTSKSTTWCVLFAAFRALLTAKRKIIELSATGFRGGQMLFNDMERWATGGWDSQLPNLTFVSSSADDPKKLVHRAQNFWEIEWDSKSSIMTLPTNDPDKIRGMRGHDLFVDEANTTDTLLIEKVALPFLNVKGGFATGGQDAQTNQVFYTATIDYSWRPFQSTKRAAYDAVARDLAAYKARKMGDLGTYDVLEAKGLHKATYTSFDYTDTIIRRTITTRAGRTWRVNYPDPALRWQKFARGIPFTTRGADGVVQMESPPCEGITTYPIDKDFAEQGLLDGSASEAVWLSEQRNVTDTAAGDVYNHALVDRACCFGDQSVLKYSACPPSWQKHYAEGEWDYAPTVQWSSTDPCVLGVDYAGGDRDFSAFVVIRLGPLADPANADDAFDPLTGLGRTPWSNVVWAEQQRLMSHPEVADKIREFSTRYNLVWFNADGEADDWKVCRAVGLDMRGGGTGVRDQLVYIDKQVLEAGQKRIYDPLDKDPRVEAFARDPDALPMLDTIMPTDELNHVLVEFTVAQMQQQRLYLPQQRPESRRGGEHKLDIGYNGALTLDRQLRKLQQKPTKSYRHFYMQGSKELVENKKDVWAAFIYAAKQMRAHIIRRRMIDEAAPPMGMQVVKINSGRPGTSRGRVPGSRF